jgi:hypothetical protein
MENVQRRKNMKKTHHNPDYAKDKTADVIKKGSGPAIPNQQWEINRDLTPKGSNYGIDAFNPRPGKERPTVYPKTNECDH